MYKKVHNLKRSLEETRRNKNSLEELLASCQYESNLLTTPERSTDEVKYLKRKLEELNTQLQAAQDENIRTEETWKSELQKYKDTRSWKGGSLQNLQQKQHELEELEENILRDQALLETLTEEKILKTIEDAIYFGTLPESLKKKLTRLGKLK